MRALSVLICVLISAPTRADIADTRQLYERALVDFRNGDLAEFEAAKAQLSDYVLFPYLEYADMKRRMRTLKPREVRQFRKRYPDTPLANRLLDSFLVELARRGAWRKYLEFYQPSSSAELQCFYLRALDHHGDGDRAMAQVAPLWRVGTSQPKACDPLFADWIQRGNLTYGLVWERLTLAMQARQWQLARYLINLPDAELRPPAQLYYQVFRNPKLVTESRRFDSDLPQHLSIIEHGVRRLAMSDPEAASAAWARYRERFSFAPETARIIEQDLAIGFARRGKVIDDADLSPSPDGRHLLVFEAQLLAAIGNEDWSRVLDLTRRLDVDERAKPRWQYWQGRAQRELDDGTADAEAGTATDPWVQLATERHYYGFLAAEGLGIKPTLNDQSSVPDATAIAHLQAIPAMQRIDELYALGDLTDARREWNFLFPSLDAQQAATAAYQMAQMGWIFQSIMVANQADQRDDLALRFPNPYLQLFRTASHATEVPLGFLYGITRQESAFAPAARSSAGALGLMQLMPATAAITARARGESAPSDEQLLQPNINIRIGSAHLADLMKRFDGNRVLVAAGYNAGPHRVDRWLHERPARPADVFIETIPFFETRNYVMNVLAFAYVYGQRINRPSPFLAPVER